MSQTTSAPGGDSLLPEPGPATVRADRSKSEATPKRKDAEQKDKSNRNPFVAIWRFIREIIAEMKKVRRPTGKELWSYFLVVVVFVAFMMAFTGLVDLGSGTLSSLIFG